jgi:hypothetical protein
MRRLLAGGGGGSISKRFYDQKQVTTVIDAEVDDDRDIAEF